MYVSACPLFCLHTYLHTWGHTWGSCVCSSIRQVGTRNLIVKVAAIGWRGKRFTSRFIYTPAKLCWIVGGALKINMDLRLDCRYVLVWLKMMSWHEEEGEETEKVEERDDACHK